MPTCGAKKSSAPLYANYWENCGGGKVYDGYYRFDQDQFYDGEFFRDKFHGQGTYNWKNFAVYEGGFYSNFKEGYATLSFPDNSYFEGLFIQNKPFGPGVLTYANGRQDAGFWMGKKLVRLSRAVDFIIPRLAPTSAAKIKLLQFRRLIPLNEGNCESAIEILKKTGCLVEPPCNPYSSVIYDPRSIFFETEVFEKTYFININKLSKELMSSWRDWEDAGDEEELKFQIRQIPNHCMCKQDVFDFLEEIDTCNKESFKGEYEMGILANLTKFGTIDGPNYRTDDVKSDLEIPNKSFTEEESEDVTKDNSTGPKLVSWNRSEMCTEMIKQIFRYRAFEDNLNFNLKKLILGPRTAFRKTGKKEKQCVQFLKMCSIGPPHVIKEFLCNYDINEELMDARGNNSLMFAAAADQHEIMDILLDIGVDVNTFNDESLTPLNLCLLRRLAQANGICNWETAFLPKEIVKTSDSFDEKEDLEGSQSVTSLDRIFGDGMSISNTSSVISHKKLSAISSPTSCRTLQQSSLSVHKGLDGSKNFSGTSKITIFEISEKNNNLRQSCLDVRTQQIQKSAGAFQERDELPIPGNTDPTPQINMKIVPKSHRRDEFEKSIQQSHTDKYLFEFSFEKKPNVGGNQRKTTSAKSSKGKMSKSQNEEKAVEFEKPLELEIIEKIAKIDKTIDKLLKRGANPNISEAPKPSIHLGVYTKDVNIVYKLLLHGASPNCQLYSNEGLLTPLHVVVLQKPLQEYAEICRLLLKFGANPEEETTPEFSLHEEEKDFLVPDQGRTPLQLLCMRPDLEYINPIDSLINIGLMLAEVSNTRHFYKGHSCLTLAMHSWNLKLLQALLESDYYDPNEILGEDRGTALHVLVSTELQKKTNYETSIKICDLLIMGGANPLKKFKSPEKLIGTCVDYGYREIEEEKEKRKLNPSKKKSEKQERTSTKDYLKDHEKVVEYLRVIASDMAEKKSTKSNTGRNMHQDSFRKITMTEKASAKNDAKYEKSNQDNEESTKNVSNTAEKDKRRENLNKGDTDDVKNTNKNSELEEDKGRERLDKEEKRLKELDEEDIGRKRLDKEEKRLIELEWEDESPKRLGKKDKGRTQLDKEDKIRKELNEEDIRRKRPDKEDKRLKELEWEDKSPKRLGKKVKERTQLDKEDKILKELDEEDIGRKQLDKEDKRRKRLDKEDEKRKQSDEEDESRKRLGKKDKRRKEFGEEETEHKTNKKKKEDEGFKKNAGEKKDLEKESKKVESNSLKPIKSSVKNLSLKKLGTRSETFPEKLRQALLLKCGTSANIDINEFLVPYVVLRNGELYYRFQGRVDQKEQYSLI